MVTAAQTTQKVLKARTRIGAGGRLVIPAEIRRALGLEDGEPVVMRVEDGELRIWTISEGIRRVQERAKPYVTPGKLASDELIAERRAEVAREEQELREWEAARQSADAPVNLDVLS
jgi:AbrB family looped-hinge helix DNA binding protein